MSEQKIFRLPEWTGKAEGTACNKENITQIDVLVKPEDPTFLPDPRDWRARELRDRRRADAERNREALPVLLQGLPVRWRGTSFPRISGMIARAEKSGYIRTQLELMDPRADCVYLVSPRELSLPEAERQDWTTGEDFTRELEDMKAALREGAAYRWKGKRYARLCGIRMQPEGGRLTLWPVLETADGRELDPYRERPRAKKPEGKPRGKRFTPPTAEEVAAYCGEKHYPVDPEAFVAFYESKGWKVGNQGMKDWRAAVRTWALRDRKRAGEQPRGARTYDIDELETMSKFNLPEGFADERAEARA